MTGISQRRNSDLVDILRADFKHRSDPTYTQENYLAADAASGTSTIVLKTPIPRVDDNMIWVVIRPFHANCEVKKVTAVASDGVTLTLDSNLSNHHRPDTDETLEPVLWLDRAFINVKWFGARGDNSTNDTTAIQNALDEAGNIGGATVYVPTGIYNIHTALDMSSGTYLRGENWQTVLKMANNTNLTQIIGGTSLSNIEVSNIRLDGNKANQSSNFLHGIRFTGCTYVFIDKVYAHDFRGATGAGNEATGIRLRGTTNYDAYAVISNCLTEDNGGVGIGTYRVGSVIYALNVSRNNDSMGLSMSTDSLFNSNNVIVGCRSQDNGEAGINLEHHSDVTVGDCAVSGHNGVNGLAGLRIADCRRTSVSNLSSENDEYGVRVASTTSAYPDSTHLDNISVQSSTNEGIILAGGSSTAGRVSLSNIVIRDAGADGIEVQNTIRIVEINGGEISGAGDIGIRSEATTDTIINGMNVVGSTNVGIRIDTAGTFAISGSQVNRNGAWGIRIEDTQKGGAITGCTANDNGQNSSNTYDGIYLNGVDQVACVGNNVCDNQGSPTQRSGIREAGTADYNSIVGNIALNNVGTQIVTVGGNTKVAHNIGSATHNT